MTTGDALSILISTERAGDPQLYGSHSEQVDCALVTGRYRWMYGSGMFEPMSRIKNRGHARLEQLLSLSMPDDEGFVDVCEICGETA